MITSIIAFLTALLLASLLTPVIRHVALARGWLDPSASSRKVHHRPIPRLGGIAIVAAFYAPLVGLLLVNSEVGNNAFLVDRQRVIGIFVGGLVITIAGVFDDFRGLGPAKKLFAQVIAAALMYGLGYSIHTISTPWGALPLGSLSLPFTLFWIVGVINALNLVDGLDGLASGVAFVAVATNFVIAASTGNVLMMLYMGALAGAILGFLIYNFNPASIFMGDTGSMFLGFVIASTSIVTNSKSSATVAMLVPILALGLPIMDTFLAMGRRAVRGLPLFSADKEHIHHKLLALGWSQRKVVLALYGLCLFFAVVGLAVTFANGRQTALILAMVVVVVAVLIRKLGYFSLAAPENRVVRERNLEIRDEIKNITTMLQNAAQPAQAWQALEPIGRAMGAAELSLTLRSQSKGRPSELSAFTWKIEGSDQPRVKLKMPLESAGEKLGELEVAWQDGRSTISRDDEIALEMLMGALVAAAKRLAPKG